MRNEHLRDAQVAQLDCECNRSVTQPVRLVRKDVWLREQQRQKRLIAAPNRLVYGRLASLVRHVHRLARSEQRARLGELALIAQVKQVRVSALEFCQGLRARAEVRAPGAQAYRRRRGCYRPKYRRGRRVCPGRHGSRRRHVSLRPPELRYLVAAGRGDWIVDEERRQACSRIDCRLLLLPAVDGTRAIEDLL